MEAIDPNKFYRYRDIARNGWLGLGEMGVYALVRSGKLKSVNVSSGNKAKRYIIRGEWILEFLRDNQSSPIKKF